jgi:hypothetical protein
VDKYHDGGTGGPAGTPAGAGRTHRLVVALHPALKTPALKTPALKTTTTPHAKEQDND